MTEKLNIKAVSRLVGLSEHTIRAWEKRYGAITPERASTGRRTYSMAETERLQTLYRLVCRGHSISSIASLPMPNLKQLLEPRKTEAKAEESPPPASVTDLQATHEAILGSLRRFDFDALSPQIAKAALRFDIHSFIHGVALPLMREVGRQVDTGSMLIAQEHALSVMLRDQLGQMLKTLNTDNHRGKKIAVATPGGDIHEFGILLSGIVAAALGWSVQYLGPNLPSEELARACAALECDVALLGTAPVPPEELKQPWKDYLRDLDDKLPKRAALWIGGAAALDGPLPRLKLRRGTEWIDSIEKLERLLQEHAEAKRS